MSTITKDTKVPLGLVGLLVDDSRLRHRWLDDPPR
jgi:hypothetical protein